MVTKMEVKTICACGHDRRSHDMNMESHLCLMNLCMCWDFEPSIKEMIHEKVV